MPDPIPKILSILKKQYGTPRFDSFKDPLDELIVTILSQNTTWQNCSRAFNNLKKAFPHWRRAAKAKPEQIQRAIKCGGLGRIKANRIKNVLKQIYKIKGSYSLNFLSHMGQDEALRLLISFKGVGPKTAACVLLFSLRMPVLPVDTHILRISKRLGLIPSDANLEEAHGLLGEKLKKAIFSLPPPSPRGGEGKGGGPGSLPGSASRKSSRGLSPGSPREKRTILLFHINMIQHGREICKARNPRCSICPLKSLCAYVK